MEWILNANRAKWCSQIVGNVEWQMIGNLFDFMYILHFQYTGGIEIWAKLAILFVCLFGLCCCLLLEGGGGNVELLWSTKIVNGSKFR